MDITDRKISKIARSAQKYTNGSLNKLGVGSTEYECLQVIRRNEGSSQSFLREQLHVDKAAVTRMIASLEKKGLITRSRDEQDKRTDRIYSTEKALEIRADKMGAEAMFYEWLLEDCTEEELAPFLAVLEKLWVKARDERRGEYQNFKEWLNAKNTENPK